MIDHIAPRPAATVILVRGAHGAPEILLLKRSAAAKFMPNAYVFAGGALDPQDTSAAISALCSQPDDEAASRRLSIDSGGQGYFIAAVREAFEECGLLLAYDAAGALVEFTRDATEVFRPMREQLCSGSITLSGLCEANGWRVALDRLFYFAHWVTPASKPRRFDTRFFLAVAPALQTASLVGQEMSELRWCTAQDALNDHAAGAILLFRATQTLLEEMARFESIDSLLAFAQQPREIHAVRP